jgi:folate-binding protein YgfZ
VTTSTTLPGEGAVTHVTADRVTPADYGDSRGEFQALLSTCGVYDLSSRGKIAVTGSDRVRWLNGMATNNVRDLAAGYGVYAFLLNAQGRIQADLYIFQRGESLLLDVEGEQHDKILGGLDRYIIADDVELADVSDKIAMIGLTGPQSRQVLERAGITVPELLPLQFAEVMWRDKSLTVLRGGEEMGESWQLWVAPEQKVALWEALIAAQARLVGTNALNLFRISRGVPKIGVDIRDRDLPQETGQTRALNFNKGCYLGQEIVERIRSRGAVHRQFMTFNVEGAVPEAGTKILAEEKEVGEITSSAILPLSAVDKPVALGYLRREAIGKELSAGEAKLTVAKTPIS